MCVIIVQTVCGGVQWRGGSGAVPSGYKGDFGRVCAPLARWFGSVRFGTVRFGS